MQQYSNNSGQKVYNCMIKNKYIDINKFEMQ